MTVLITSSALAVFLAFLDVSGILEWLNGLKGTLVPCQRAEWDGFSIWRKEISLGVESASRIGLPRAVWIPSLVDMSKKNLVGLKSPSLEKLPVKGEHRKDCDDLGSCSSEDAGCSC